MIIHGAMTVWLLCLLGEARGVGVDLGTISYGYTGGYDDQYVIFQHNVEGYSMKLGCTNCVKVDGARIYCDKDVLLNVTVDLERGVEHVSVPFNVSCHKTRNIASVANIAVSAHPQSIQLSWRVINGSMDKYVIHLVAQGEYRYTAVTTRSRSFLLESLKERTEYRICVATVDGRLETGVYRCMSQETDSMETGPVENVTVTALDTSVAISWRKPHNDLYAPSSYTVDYRETRGGSCMRIVVTMGASGGTQNQGVTPSGCVLKRDYTWTKLKPLTIDDLLPYTLYNITILPVNRGKAQVAVTRSVRTREGRSGKVANLRTTTVSGWLRVYYEAPPQPRGAVTGYRVTVVLMRGGLCEQGRARTIENTTVTATYHDVLLTTLTRCSQYDIAVAPINGWRLEGGVGEPASVVFDYAPEGDLTISNTKVRVVSSNLVQISWDHRDHKDDCPNIGFLVELANKADAADCVSQVIYNGSCARLTEMVRQASPCAHTETRNTTATGPSRAVTIGTPLGPSRAYAVRIWKISKAVVMQGAPLSLSGTDAGCFTDCYGGAYAGVRSHGGCVAWRHSHWRDTHPSRADSTCTMKTGSRPWCSTATSYEYCDVPRCSLPSPATGCVRDVRQETGTSRTTLTWTPPPHGLPMIGVIALLHRDDGTCERSNLHLGAATAGEGALGVALRAFYVRCGNATTARGALNSTVFDNLHQHRRYRVYIVPLVSASQAGEVRNVSVTTLLARPDPPRSVNVTGRSTASLAFTWPKVTEDATNGAADRYEVQLMRSTTLIKAKTTTSEGASFAALAECSEHCVTVYAANAAGRSEYGEPRCAFTLAPGLGAVEVRDIESGPRGQREVAWRYSGRDECPRSYGVRYGNKFMKESAVTKKTNGTSITLGNLARNTLYTVAVRAETRMDTEDGAKERAFSEEKEFYTGSVVPGVYEYKEDFTAERTRLNISWGFNSSGDGSVFEFVLLVKNASDSCISTTHFLCRSCPPPYRWANLDNGNLTTRQRLLSCSPPSVVEFTRDAASLHRSLDIDVASTNFTVEIHAINLVGVHHVYGAKTVYKPESPSSASASVAAVCCTLIILVAFLILLLRFRHQPRCIYDVIAKTPPSNGIVTKRLIPSSSTLDSGVNHREEPSVSRKLQGELSSKVPRRSVHSEAKENVPLLEPKRKNNGVALKEFPKYYQKMVGNKNDLLIQEYKKLTAECKKMERDLGLTVNTGKAPENSKKNRFVNILPFDQTRVLVEGKANDYTNANYIPFLNEENNYEYIASQGPIDDSIQDFWKMIWTQNVNCIVMLTRTMEEEKFKCLQYWPENRGDTQTYGHGGELTVTLVEETELESHIERVILIKEAESAEERSIVQLHMHTWFDHSAPNLEYFDKLLFRFHEVTNDSATTPYLIHCSAGVGRTGTLICIDRIIKQLVSGIQEINIYDTVFTLRHYRNFMVQRQAQYIFIHDYIEHFLKKYMKADDDEEVLYFNED